MTAQIGRRIPPTNCAWQKNNKNGQSFEKRDKFLLNFWIQRDKIEQERALALHRLLLARGVTTTGQTT
ncbi:MAG: hypothetical protein ACO4B5_12220 [Steroidobacteraceae bacterium]